MVLPADPVGLLAGGSCLMGLSGGWAPLVEAIGWDEAATMTPGTPEEGFAGHSFTVCIDRPGVAGNVLETGGHQT